MKQFIAVSVCLLISGISFAQKNVKKSPPHRSAVAGVILDMRKQPIIGVEAFIYAKDSSIVASGYTDATGYYETNFTMPGIYDLKLVYPSAKYMMIKAVPVKATELTMINIKAIPPDADTTVSYAEMVPKNPQTPKGASAKR